MKIKDAILELQKQDPEAEMGMFIESQTDYGHDRFNRRMEIATGYIEKDPELQDWSGCRIRRFKTQAASFKVVYFKR
jgi:hypothetical protein